MSNVRYRLYQVEDGGDGELPSLIGLPDETVGLLDVLRQALADGRASLLRDGNRSAPGTYGIWLHSTLFDHDNVAEYSGRVELHADGTLTAPWRERPTMRLVLLPARGAAAVRALR